MKACAKNCVNVATLAILMVLTLSSLPTKIRAQDTPITELRLDPPIKVAALNETFTVSIVIDGAINLYGFEFKLSYRTQVFDAKSVALGPFLNKPSTVVKNVTDEPNGTILLNATSISPAQAVNGTGTLAYITFKASQVGGGPVDFLQPKLVDSKGALIPDVPAYGAQYPIVYRVTPTTVYLNPSEIEVNVSQSFTINVMIKDIDALFGYQFYLYYDTKILDGIEVQAPPDHFLNPVDSTKIFWAKQEVNDNFNSTHGQVLVAATLLPPEAPKNGSGVLVSVNFKAVGAGESSLHFQVTNPTTDQPLFAAKPAYVGGPAIPIYLVPYDGSIKVKESGQIGWFLIPPVVIGAVILIAFVAIIVGLGLYLSRKPKKVT